MCGETITFSSWKKRLSEDAGSSSKTSMPAARIFPLSSPTTSAFSSWVLPRDVFTKMTPSFIWATAAASIMWCVSLVCGVWQVTTSAWRSTEAMSGMGSTPRLRISSAGTYLS